MKNNIDQRKKRILEIWLLSFILFTIPFYFLEQFFTPSARLIRILFISICSILGLILLKLSRDGKSELSAKIFVSFVGLISLAEMLFYGIDNIWTTLFIVLSVVISGLVVNSKFALRLFAIEAIMVIVITIFHINGYLINFFDPGDSASLVNTSVVVLMITLIVISAVLTNNEIANALNLSMQSELKTKELAKKLDYQNKNLAEIVELRTKKLEEAQRRRLDEIKKFANIGKITSGLIHDLSSPLTVALARADELSDTKVSKKSLNSINSLKSSVERIRTYILNTRKQLINEEELRNFYLSEEISSVIDLVTEKATLLNIKIKKSLNKEIKMHGDAVKFGQIVLNLLLNSIESFEGVPLLSKIERFVWIKLVKENTGFVLEVTDNGAGIPKKYLDSIFDPLFTTKQKGESSGLGLYLTKNYVEQFFGGRIELKSQIKKGTTFRIFFPNTGNKKVDFVD